MTICRLCASSVTKTEVIILHTNKKWKHGFWFYLSSPISVKLRYGKHNWIFHLERKFIYYCICEVRSELLDTGLVSLLDIIPTISGNTTATCNSFNNSRNTFIWAEHHQCEYEIKFLRIHLIERCQVSCMSKWNNKYMGRYWFLLDMCDWHLQPWSLATVQCSVFLLRRLNHLPQDCSQMSGKMWSDTWAIALLITIQIAVCKLDHSNCMQHVLQ